MFPMSWPLNRRLEGGRCYNPDIDWFPTYCAICSHRRKPNINHTQQKLHWMYKTKKKKFQCGVWHNNVFLIVPGRYVGRQRVLLSEIGLWYCFLFATFNFTLICFCCQVQLYSISIWLLCFEVIYCVWACMCVVWANFGYLRYIFTYRMTIAKENCFNASVGRMVSSQIHQSVANERRIGVYWCTTFDHHLVLVVEWLVDCCENGSFGMGEIEVKFKVSESCAFCWVLGKILRISKFVCIVLHLT